MKPPKTVRATARLSAEKTTRPQRPCSPGFASRQASTMSTTHPRPTMTIPIWIALRVGASVTAASAAFGWMSASRPASSASSHRVSPDSKRDPTETPAAARQLRRTRQHQRHGQKGQASASLDALAALETCGKGGRRARCNIRGAN